MVHPLWPTAGCGDVPCNNDLQVLRILRDLYSLLCAEYRRLVDATAGYLINKLNHQSAGIAAGTCRGGRAWSSAAGITRPVGGSQALDEYHLAHCR